MSESKTEGLGAGLMLDEAMRSVAAELDAIAERTDRLHDLVFSTSSGSPDAAGARHVQAIDSNIQILADLSAFLRDLSETLPGHDLGDPHTALRALTLNSLKSRIVGRRREGGEAPGGETGDLELF
ncbi:hypothetical protein DYI37_05995 [Fulvimarina endophytica]|uniref:Uncharacterized protein n=1 Tax=Fulvimarina endophytica TaxID=2293836 RepID=A0A371X8I0_9HYPH|nr:hypothetical protein [Fulvimarina endophytica]RFC65374.1 hypothetical protein DYI37_05995 [Fulvimarina endophytica]